MAPKAENSGKLFGALAEFESASSLYHACEKVRDAKFRRWDAHSPFPIHGIEEAMGLPGSKLGYVVFVMGLMGAGGALLLQWWTNAVDYPFIISGKPLFSWQAFVPICFELMVLFSAFGCFFGMLHFNKLPQYYHSLFRSKRFERVTDDKFFISIEAADPRFDEAKTVQLLKDIGATHVELVED